MCGAWSRPTWRSPLPTSRERPSKKRPELWRRCEARPELFQELFFFRWFRTHVWTCFYFLKAHALEIVCYSPFAPAHAVNWVCRHSQSSGLVVGGFLYLRNSVGRQWESSWLNWIFNYIPATWCCVYKACLCRKAETIPKIYSCLYQCQSQISFGWIKKYFIISLQRNLSY